MLVGCWSKDFAVVREWGTFAAWLEHSTAGRFDRAVATANGVFEPNKFENNLVQKELEECLDRALVGFARS